MKIILDDFYYKGKHFKQYECELPQVNSLNDIPEEKLVECIIEDLNDFLKLAGES